MAMIGPIAQAAVAELERQAAVDLQVSSLVDMARRLEEDARALLAKFERHRAAEPPVTDRSMFGRQRRRQWEAAERRLGTEYAALAQRNAASEVRSRAFVHGQGAVWTDEGGLAPLVRGALEKGR